MPRSKLPALALVVCALSACATAPSAPPPPRGARFVLVPLSVRLRQRPRDDAPALHFRPGGTSLEVAAFRRVRARGEWVQIETPTRPERQCHPTLSVPDGMRLRFWVRAEELAPALLRTVTRRGPDGSALRARAGLHVVWDGELAQLSLAPGTRASLALSPDEVGAAFAEPRPASAREPGERLVGDLNLGFLDGGRFMTTRGSAPVYVTERRAERGAYLAQVRTACAELTVRVQPDQVVPVMTVEVEERPAPSAAPVETATIAAGSRLRWSDGGAAGTVDTDLELNAPSRRIGGVPCYSVPVSVRGVEGLRPARVEVCAQPPPEE